MRVGSLFAGVGGFDLAAENIGLDVLWHSEVDKYCLRVLGERFPGVDLAGGVEEVNARSVAPVDILIGGSPCQGFSVAGVGMGLEDPRSGLFGEMMRIADEIEPTWVLWENVPGALTSGKGEDFANVLAALVGADEPLLLPNHPNGRRSRYAGVARGPKGVFAWRVLDAQYFGVPQRRSRVIGLRAPDERAVLALLGTSVLPPWRDVEASNGAWATAVDEDDSAYDWHEAPENPKTVRLADCVETDPAEYEDFMLSEKACKGILERATRRGKAMPSLLELALTVSAGLEPSDELTERALGDSAVGDLAVDLALHAVMFRKSRRAASNTDFETWVPDDAGNTLNTFENSDVRATTVVVCHPDPAGNLTERYHKGVNTTFDDGAVVIRVSDLRVRRLTPRECERLQGFPDDHTRVKGASATQRFKQMGNAVAVPVAEYALRCIVDAEARHLRR